MELKEISTGSYVIAQFMGAKITKGEDSPEAICLVKYMGMAMYYHLGTQLADYPMPFHTSWDYLMPVAKKAFSRGDELEKKYKGDTATTYLRRDVGAAQSIMISGLLEFNIDTVYAGVVACIEAISGIEQAYNLHTPNEINK